MLFDLQAGSNEVNDTGELETSTAIVKRLSGQLNAWYRMDHYKTMISEAAMLQRENGDLNRRVYLGFWDEANVDEVQSIGRSGN